jgi:hypothetical protein
MSSHQIKQIAQPLMFHTARGVSIAVREAMPADRALLAELLGDCLSARSNFAI